MGNNNIATMGLKGEFRAFFPVEIYQMVQFGEFRNITKTLLHKIQFLMKERMVIQLNICFVCSGACSPEKYKKWCNLARLEYIW